METEPQGTEPTFDTPPPEPVDTPGAEERQWGMFAHASAIAAGIITANWAFSLGCFVGPLIIWMLKRDEMPFVDNQGKEALNFNITVGIAFLVLFLLTMMTFGIGIFITLPLYAIIGLAWLVLSIIASINAYQGEAYRYPFTLRLIK